MNQNNNLSVLPFYDSVDKQLRKRTYAYGEVYPLYVQKGYALPFQLMVPKPAAGQEATAIQTVTLTDANTGLQTSDYTNNLTIVKKEFDDYDIFVHRFTSLGGAFTAPIGRYYFQIQTNHDAYVSEVFTVVDDISPYLRIEWWDDQDLVMRDGRIVYNVTSGILYHSVVFLDTQLGMPEYEFEEEGETRDGLYFPEKMISEKTYKFSFLAPEYLLDAMRFIRMSDHIKITDRYGNEYNADTFLLTPKWQAPGMLAGVDGEFQTASVAKKIGRDF